MTYQQLNNLHTQLKSVLTSSNEEDFKSGHLEKLEEICDDLESILDPEPSDQEMMPAFGTKWHDGL